VSYHLVHGLILHSHLPLPIPTVSAATPDVEFVVDLGRSPPGPSIHVRSDDPEEPWSIERWGAGWYEIEFTGRATFELDRGHIVLRADLTADPDLVVHLLLDHVLPRVVALRGDLMLHAAGAVGPSGDAHLLLGDTGAGKSTLAAMLAAHGWGLLDDDGVRVTAVDGRFRAVPGYATVRLMPTAATAVLGPEAMGRPIAKGRDKRSFLLDGHGLRLAGGPAPIRGVYLLRRSEGSAPAIERRGVGEALGAIVEHAFHSAEDPKDITRLAFERAAALAASVPFHVLRHPDGFDHLARTVGFLEELDGAG
jgi:energy-coupling factor transporter ATP-binding protein EcfA2